MRDCIELMSAPDLEAATDRLIHRLKAGPLSEIASGMTVALFGGIQGEPDLTTLIPWLMDKGASPVLFGLGRGGLIAQVVTTSSSLSRGPFGVWIPQEDCPPLALAHLDIILVPGLAFDRHGGRLGRGRGYFDRLFATPEVRAQRIGICFEDQIVDAVPVEPHDARMQMIVTDRSHVIVQPPSRS